MAAQIIARTDRGFTIQVQVLYQSSMLDAEEAIQAALNDAGVVATAEALERCDADGKPIRIGPTKLTSKGKLLKQYQTPYGVASIKRHVYQTSRGGRTFCPLDQNARIVVSSTPRFARMLSHKYAEFGSARVTEDLQQNHGRTVARSFVQNVADAVSAVALAKEEAWEYALPKLDRPPATVTISLDGTCVLMCEDGWREAMVGSIGLYDREGERLHTIYAAATPEYGKLTFTERLDREIDRVKAAYPEALYVGLADGAKDNWPSLERKTQRQVVDFYHVTRYVWSAAEALFAGTPAAAEMRPWIDDWCHRLKHEPGAAATLIADLEVRGQALGKKRLPTEVEAALTYLRNQLKGDRLDYPALVGQHVPIGSGVTEAACKVLVKQRLCGSGMKWKERGAAAVLSVRALTYTAGRWSQFWGKIDRYGFPVAA